MSSNSINLIQSLRDIEVTIPDHCPYCHHGIKPSFVIGYHFELDLNHHWRLTFICPRQECQEIFFAFYSKSTLDFNHMSSPGFRGCAPYSFKEELFNDAIKEISPSFVTIYNQAKHAEARKLDEICGLGYRKALEFLIKEYLVTIHPSEAEDIKKNHKFDSVIEKYVSDEKVKFLAKRAAWLGNDYAHYTRKWEDKDITDLKRLINTAVYWISAEKELEYYESEMSEGKK